ncbi:Cytoplasmic membrane protein LemA [Streptococcus pneumoniae]|nr:Cytoplasmic membrane protein LemA [Streptococcus pneumoniae]
MTWIILGVLALVVIFVIVSYNGLVKNRMQTKEAWSQIDVQLKRRNDLLPNLIETVKGYAKYEPKSFIPLSTRCNLQNP